LRFGSRSQAAGGIKSMVQLRQPYEAEFTPLHHQAESHKVKYFDHPMLPADFATEKLDAALASLASAPKPCVVQWYGTAMP
jgi:hypothetical protein